MTWYICILFFCARFLCHGGHPVFVHIASGCLVGVISKYLFGSGVSHHFWIGLLIIMIHAAMWYATKNTPLHGAIFFYLSAVALWFVRFQVVCSGRWRRFLFSKDSGYMAVASSACMCSTARQHALAKVIPKPGWLNDMKQINKYISEVGGSEFALGQAPVTEQSFRFVRACAARYLDVKWIPSANLRRVPFPFGPREAFSCEI